MTVLGSSLSLRLSRLTAHDADLVRQWRNSPAVAEGMITEHAISAAEHDRWLKRVLVSPDCRYWVIRAAEQPVGLAYLYDIDWGQRRCTWGFYVADVDLRGRGVASSALAAVLDHAFGEMGLEAVMGEVLASNAASLAIHRQLGFSLERRLPEAATKRDRSIDVDVLRLDGDQWNERRQPGDPVGARTRFQNWRVTLEK